MKDLSSEQIWFWEMYCINWKCILPEDSCLYLFPFSGKSLEAIKYTLAHTSEIDIVQNEEKYFIVHLISWPTCSEYLEFIVSALYVKNKTILFPS